MSDIRFEGWLHRSGTGGVYQDSTGNVGIASTQPQQKLDIGNGGFTVGSTGICTALAFIPSQGQITHRNLIINGAMQVAQRSTAAVESTTNGYHTVDRWGQSNGGLDQGCTTSQVDVASGTTPYTEGFRKAFKIRNGNQSSGAGAGDYYRIYQFVEAQNMASSGWNYTSTSSDITVSFWIKSEVAQNFYVELRTQDGTQQAYVWETGSLTADAWTKVTKTIPGNSNIQIDNDNSHGPCLFFHLFNGTNMTGSMTLNQWAAYDTAVRTPDMTSTWYTTNNAEIEITGVQLEVGSVATPFEHLTFGDELLKCQRYFQGMPTSGDHVMWGFGRAESNAARVAIPLTVPMRAAPTITCDASRAVKYDGTMNQTTATPSVSTYVNDFATITINFGGHSSLSHNNVYIVTSDSGSTGLQLDADL